MGLEDGGEGGWNENIELVVHDWSVDVLADDWSGVSEWLELLDMAERHPGALVLSGERNYRLSDAAKLVVALSVRCALQAVLANRAISQLGNSALLEKRGFWPASDKVYERVASPLHRAALKMLEFVSWFSVEDEDSLEQLMRACRREMTEIVRGSPKVAGEKAYDCLQLYVLQMHDAARTVLRRLA